MNLFMVIGHILVEIAHRGCVSFEPRPQDIDSTFRITTDKEGYHLFSLSGRISIKKGRLASIVLKDGYPLMNRIVVSFSALLAASSVQVIVGET